jgi:hypothetical protein
VIPRDHPVVQTKHDIVEAEVVVDRRRQPLECQPPVVGNVTDGAALKRRKPGDGVGAARRQRTTQAAERVRLSFRRHDDGERIGRDVRVATETRLAERAVKEDAVRQIGQLLDAANGIWRRDKLLNERVSG